jgi:hypothetical protein
MNIRERFSKSDDIYLGIAEHYSEFTRHSKLWASSEAKAGEVFKGETQNKTNKHRTEKNERKK